MDLGLLLLRLLIGLTMAAHGSQKLFGAFGGGGLAGTGPFMEHLGFRPGRRHALLAALTEVGSGLGIALGLLTPLAAAAMVGVMAVAAIAAHGGKGFFITKGGWEYCFLLGGAAACVAFTGPGAWSVDHLIGLDNGGLLWGLFAVVAGFAGAAAQLAMRRTEVDLRQAGPTTAASEPAAR
jgi:putative oxidoreductase